MKIALNYDLNTGDISDNTGTRVGNWMGLENYEIQETNTVTIDEVCKLKSAGFTAEEIIELKRKEVI